MVYWFIWHVLWRFLVRNNVMAKLHKVLLFNMLDSQQFLRKFEKTCLKIFRRVALLAKLFLEVYSISISFVIQLLLAATSPKRVKVTGVSRRGVLATTRVAHPLIIEGVGLGSLLNLIL